MYKLKKNIDNFVFVKQVIRIYKEGCKLDGGFYYGKMIFFLN